jgi:translin
MEISHQLDPIMEDIRAHFLSKNKAREQGLPLCREAIRHSANGIRAVHRRDFQSAQELIDKAGALLRQVAIALQGHPDIFHAGFVHDSQKEFAEASLTLALVADRPLPTPQALGVEDAAYLNGLGEAVGELRRHLLDSLRTGDVGHCEQCLTAMDDIYSVLITFDYPEAMTSGLRRTTDAVRGILERTRGDLTLAVRQRDLECKLGEFEDRIKR